MLTIPALSAIFVVLTSPFPKNPASAIGHVLLLEADSTVPYLLWNTVGYMADIGDNVSGFTYITTGIFGGFPAFYEILPFYEKIDQYSDIEKRDLWLYPLRISEAELQRFNDTLAVWAVQEYPYRFFTLNCVNGIYNLFKATLDSIPKAYYIMTPQNFIELLHNDHRLGEPIRLYADGRIAKEPSKYLIPHKYSRLDIGISFEDEFYFRVRFRPLLHSLKDRSLFYTPFMEFELFALETNFNRNNFDIQEFWLLKIQSISPHDSFSWMFNTGILPINAELGIGQTYKMISTFCAGFLFRHTIVRIDKCIYNLSGLRIFTGNFSNGILRFGVYGEYLYNFTNASNNILMHSWLAFDISRNLSVFGEFNWRNNMENSVGMVTAFYF